MPTMPDNSYQVMPSLTPEEYGELKADIAERGVMVPIEYDEAGNVLDGHHRLLVCQEMGIRDFPKAIRLGLSESEKRAHVRKVNMARRHLTQEQKRLIIQDQLTETPEKSDRQIAAGLGVSNKTVSDTRKRMEDTGQVCKLHTSIGADGKGYPRRSQRKSVAIFDPSPREEKAMRNPAVVEKLTSGESASVLAASKAARKENRALKKAHETPAEIPDTCRLFAADIRSGLSEVADNSVDFIITDPPYPKEYIPLYGELSKLAARVLKPGGSLLAMCGQSWLPEVMTQLGREMVYHWPLCYTTPGGQSPGLWQKHVNTFWKPILWYTKGEYVGDVIGDVIKSETNDKRFHHWGQSVGGFREIIEKFTYPGQTILDPFLGGGTTGVAAVVMGRCFIGCDIEPKNVDITHERMQEVLHHERSASGANRLEG